MITATEYTKLCAKINTFETARARLFPRRNGLSQEDMAKLPEHPTNGEHSAVEVYEFCAKPPDKYFAYIKEVNGYPRELTTWTGDYLGAVATAGGGAYRDNFGGIRVPISIIGINGKEYYGTYYKSSGNYCRIRLKKGQK